MNLDEVIECLHRPRKRLTSGNSLELKQTLKQLKETSVDAGDEQAAKELWCYEAVLEVQDLYAQAFQQLKHGDYYKGWCSLEQVELAINRLMPHLIGNAEMYAIDYIAKHTSQMQGLFPYKLFASAEMIHKREKCNVCGSPVALRRPCGHLVGEVYGGEYCYRIVEDVEFVGVAFTEKPAMKTNVLFITNPETGLQEDQYDYFVVQYLIEHLANPYDAWTVETETKLHPRSEFGRVGRNNLCPCGSNTKYKRCCELKAGVSMPHWQFTFTVLPNDTEDRLIIRRPHRLKAAHQYRSKVMSLSP